MLSMKLTSLLLTGCLIAAWPGAGLTAEPSHVLDLWPGIAPGDPVFHGQERDMTKPSDGLVASRRVIRLGDVYHPTLSVYSPRGRGNGTAVLVCPGGAYAILAMDLEGTEICRWLNSLGVTGVLLKYRVPSRPGRERYAAALQDAERAMGLVRLHAKEWGLIPDRIGVLGFSAGGNLAALVSNPGPTRTYQPLDDADALSCRPDFTLLIYPAYLKGAGPGNTLAPEFHLSAQTPPTFLVMAQDDPVGVENVLDYAFALHTVKVPFELHVYPSGGHGYGLRRTKDLVTTWPQRAADWMRTRGLLTKVSRN